MCERALVTIAPLGLQVQSDHVLLCLLVCLLLVIVTERSVTELVARGGANCVMGWVPGKDLIVTKVATTRKT